MPGAGEMRMREADNRAVAMPVAGGPAVGLLARFDLGVRAQLHHAERHRGAGVGVAFATGADEGINRAIGRFGGAWRGRAGEDDKAGKQRQPADTGQRDQPMLHARRLRASAAPDRSTGPSLDRRRRTTPCMLPRLCPPLRSCTSAGHVDVHQRARFAASTATVASAATAAPMAKVLRPARARTAGRRRKPPSIPPAMAGGPNTLPLERPTRGACAK